MVSRKSQDKAMSRNEILQKRTEEELKGPDPDPEKTEGFLEDPKPEPPQEDLDEKEIVEAAQMGSGHYTVDIYGHNVTYDILNIKKQLQALELANSVRDETARALALKTAYFALSVDTIDYAPFYVKVANDGSERIQRFNIAMQYYADFISKFFDDYVERENEIEKKLDSLKK